MRSNRKILPKLRVKVVAVFALLAIPLFAGEPVSSAPCVVYANPEASIHWKTALSDQLRISIDWPEGGAKARFEAVVAGRQVSSVDLTDVSSDHYDYEIDMPTDGDSEKVVVLKLTFLDSTDAVIEERTASVGIVRGVGPASTEVVADGELSEKWAKRRTKSASAVIPIPESSGPLSIDGGDPTETDAPGWYFWTGIASGPHSLAMDVAGEEWMAEPIIKIPGGLMLLFK